MFSVMWGSIFDWYADIWDNHRNNPNVLIVFYEDIIMVSGSHMIPYTYICGIHLCFFDPKYPISLFKFS